MDTSMYKNVYTFSLKIVLNTSKISLESTSSLKKFGINSSQNNFITLTL